MGTANELRKEQTIVDKLYSRLDELRATTRSRLGAVRRQGPSGSPQNRSERDAFATLYEDRLAQLEAVEDRLAFGRLDLDDGARRYVGRIGLTDADHHPLLTDWRAPAAQAFYRATSAQREAVERRRHLITRGRRVTGIEDELLDLTGESSTSALSGEGALLASLTSGRTGRMSDIVATIQAEQDEIIRSPLTGALVVQGGPGTGKTAVALHRAAYLLYAHRRVLERSGVLMVGPSHTFLRYIDQVLPSLGETGVVSVTLGDLVPGVHVGGQDTGAVAALKGRTVFARIIERAVRARERIPAADLPLRVEGHDLVIRRRDVRDAIGKARRTHKPHNLARVTFVREMLARLADQVAADVGYPLAADDRALVYEDLRADRDVRVALNLAWLPITPQRLVEDLFVKPHRLAEAAPELSAAERASLARPKGSPWTVADVPLLDEAAELLGESDDLARGESAARAREHAADVEYARQVLSSSGLGGGMVDAELLADRFSTSAPRLTTAERAAADRSWTYGHVVVDEAQELSRMAWRMLVRRCPNRSMTIVGDVAQTSSPAGARSWRTTLDPVLRDTWRLVELTVNYRTPESIAVAATRVATAARLPVSPLTSARQIPDALQIVPTSPRDLDMEAVALARAAVEAHVDQATGTGRVAIVAAPARGARLRAVLADDGSIQGVDPLLLVADPQAVKGLEFDAVVLVEPSELASGPGGHADLYVAMTRPTRELLVLHSAALPEGLVQ